MTVRMKDLASEEGRREYYTYDPKDPSSWTVKAAPWLDPRFNDELLKRHGADMWGDQLIRIAWAGDIESWNYWIDGNGIAHRYKGYKYPYSRYTLVTGFQYLNAEGKKVTVASPAAVPPGRASVPLTEKRDLPKLHFVVEMKFTLDQLVGMGWASDPDSEVQWSTRHGVRVAEAPNPKGEYVLAYPIVDKQERYRDVVQADLDHIHEIVNRSKTETEEERLVRKQEEHARMALVMALEEEDKNLGIWDKVMTEAERKVAKGRTVYSK